MIRKSLLFVALCLLSIEYSVAQDIPSIVDIAQAFADNRLDRMEADCRARIEADSTEDAALYYLGLYLCSTGDLDAAKDCIDKAMALSPDNSAYLETALNLAYDRQDQNTVAEICRKLVRMSPAKYRTPYVLTMLGDAELRNRRDSTAMKYFQEALDIDESYASARLAIADVYFARRNYPAFFVEMYKIARSPYLEPEGVCNCINAFLQKVDSRFFQVWGKQLDELATAPLEVNPTDADCLALAGWWFYRSGRPEKALEHFETMEKESSDSYSARNNLLTFYMLEEDYGKALSQCLSMLSECKLSDKEKAALLGTAGDCCYTLGKKRKTFSFYEKAISANPEDGLLLNNYAYYLCEEGGSLKKAEEISRRALELTPESPSALDTYGWILYKMHKPAEAKPYFKKAIIYGGKDNANVLEHYSKVLEALGEKDLANYYKNLSEKNSK